MQKASVGGSVWTAQGLEKRTLVKDMFAQLAGHYDLLNSLMSFRLHYRWRTLAAQKLRLKPGDHVVDICCGTGAFLPPLKRLIGSEGSVTGFDFSLPMLKKAVERYGAKGQFALADALALPLPSESADGASVGWGIRNVVDVDLVHREIFRTLKPGRWFVSVDMAQPENAAIRRVSRTLFGSLAPILGSLFGSKTAYTYLPKSTEAFRPRKELAQSMSRSGFVDVHWQDLMLGNICIHWGRRP